MLVTDVGDGLCGDNFKLLMTDWRCLWRIPYKVYITAWLVVEMELQILITFQVRVENHKNKGLEREFTLGIRF